MDWLNVFFQYCTLSTTFHFYFTASFQYLQRFLYEKMEQRLWCAKKELIFSLKIVNLKLSKFQFTLRLKYWKLVLKVLDHRRQNLHQAVIDIEYMYTYVPKQTNPVRPWRTSLQRCS